MTDDGEYFKSLVERAQADFRSMVVTPAGLTYSDLAKKGIYPQAPSPIRSLTSMPMWMVPEAELDKPTYPPKLKRIK